jgi:isopenicillin N synthase-like dioxygenase
LTGRTVSTSLHRRNTSQSRFHTHAGAILVANIDLSKYGTPEGNKELAHTLLEAIRTKGFLYVTNFGIPQEAVDRQFALGQRFYELPLDEKLKYEPDLENGNYNGYRPAGRRLLSGDVKDKIEVWNMASTQTPLTD